MVDLVTDVANTKWIIQLDWMLKRPFRLEKRDTHHWPLNFKATPPHFRKLTSQSIRLNYNELHVKTAIFEIWIMTGQNLSLLLIDHVCTWRAWHRHRPNVPHKTVWKLLLQVSKCLILSVVIFVWPLFVFVYFCMKTADKAIYSRTPCITNFKSNVLKFYHIDLFWQI